jgi:hypothetical protein
VEGAAVRPHPGGSRLGIGTAEEGLLRLGLGHLLNGAPRGLELALQTLEAALIMGLECTTTAR